MTIRKGRVAIVTGAGQGIGKGVSLKLAENGARVVVCDINEKTAKEVADEIISMGHEAVAVAGDVGSKQDCIRFVRTSLERWGTLDILVNNAGIIRDAFIEEMTEDQWDAVLKVNLKGAFLCIQAAIKPMKLQHYGRIISISSSSCKGNLGQANYASAKAGINALTYVAAMELAKYGITANSICPGVIDTPMARSVPQKIFDRWIATIPAKRIGQPDDMAYMVMAFAAEEAGYLNGQTIYVDGGMQTGLRM